MNDAIESVVLIRRTDLTHLVDSDQRSVVLPIINRDKKQLDVQMPDNAAVLPPGHYMLFVNARDEDGRLIPSESVPVHIADKQGACQ